jgi:hypothetical protein
MQVKRIKTVINLHESCPRQLSLEAVKVSASTTLYLCKQLFYYFIILYFPTVLLFFIFTPVSIYSIHSRKSDHTDKTKGDEHVSEKINLYCGHLSDKISIEPKFYVDN